MKKALFFGDSNTYGYDPASFMGGRYPRGSRWTTLLQKKLAGEEDAWEIAADGLPGRAIPVTRYEWEYLERLLRQEMPLDLFAVMLGTNDLLSTLRPDAARTAQRMDQLLAFAGDVLAREAENREQPPQILLIAPPRIELTDQSFAEPYVSGDKSYSQIYCEEGEKLAGFYRELAAWRQILFADASGWELDFAYDGVHLSEEGHARFAAQMARVLRDIRAGGAG